MEENELLQKVVKTVTQEPALFEIDILPKNSMHAWLQKKRLTPAKQTFTVRPFTMNQLQQCSALLLSIGLENLTVDDVLRLALNHTRTAATIIAISVLPSRQQPSKKLVDFFLHNLTNDDLRMVLGIALQFMDFGSFLTSIASMRVLNILDKKTASVKSADKSEANPLSRGVPIAPGIQSAA